MYIISCTLRMTLFMEKHQGSALYDEMKEKLDHSGCIRLNLLHEKVTYQIVNLLYACYV